MKNSLIKNRRVSQFWAVCTLGALVFSSGCGQGSSNNVQIAGITGPNVSMVNNEFVMSVTFQNLVLNGGIRMPIPNMPNSYVELGPDFQSNGTLFSVGINTTDLVTLTQNSVNILNPTELPGGRPLPGVSAGQLPGFAVQVPQLDNVVFYVEQSVFGIFVPVKLGLAQAIGTFRFYDSSGNALGNISIVGNDASGANSGFLLLINVQGQVAKAMGLK